MSKGYDRVETRGVLAGAYRGAERAQLTHLVYMVGGSDLRSGCRQPLRHLADTYSVSEAEAAARPTCPMCARKFETVHPR